MGSELRAGAHHVRKHCVAHQLDLCRERGRCDDGAPNIEQDVHVALLDLQKGSSAESAQLASWRAGSEGPSDTPRDLAILAVAA